MARRKESTEHYCVQRVCRKYIWQWVFSDWFSSVSYNKAPCDIFVTSVKSNIKIFIQIVQYGLFKYHWGERWAQSVSTSQVSMSCMHRTYKYNLLLDSNSRLRYITKPASAAHTIYIQYFVIYLLLSSIHIPQHSGQRQIIFSPLIFIKRCGFPIDKWNAIFDIRFICVLWMRTIQFINIQKYFLIVSSSEAKYLFCSECDACCFKILKWLYA